MPRIVWLLVFLLLGIGLLGLGGYFTPDAYGIQDSLSRDG